MSSTIELGPNHIATSKARATEKLLALYRYESETEGGFLESELLEQLFDFAKNLLLDDPRIDIDDPNFDITTQQPRWRAMANALLRGLVEGGDEVEVMTFVEQAAERRAECDARFNVKREVPLSDEERASFAEQWEERAAARFAQSSSESEVVS